MIRVSLLIRSAAIRGMRQLPQIKQYSFHSICRHIITLSHAILSFERLIAFGVTIQQSQSTSNSATFQIGQRSHTTIKRN